jgi:hypothetical protein
LGWRSADPNTTFAAAILYFLFAPQGGKNPNVASRQSLAATRIFIF